MPNEGIENVARGCKDIQIGYHKKMDESGIEPETFRLRSKRATNYATRPILPGLNNKQDYRVYNLLGSCQEKI